MRRATIAAARTLVAQRDAWLNPPDATEADLKKRTLTNLYNAKPQWLLNAHAALDRAVAAAYGWPADSSDDTILQALLTENLRRSAATTVPIISGADEVEDDDDGDDDALTAGK